MINSTLKVAVVVVVAAVDILIFQISLTGPVPVRCRHDGHGWIRFLINGVT
jgi:hypothetical protein